MENVLEINDLTKLYKNKRGIKNISFNIQKGDVYGLLGPNGAGKTTVMKLVTGLSKPQKGTIKIFNNSIETHHEECLQQLGSLIEAPAFIGYLSAQKNMEMVAKYYGTQSNIDKVLDVVGMLKYKKEKPDKFSLGMKQRLGIALALIGNPKLIVLDEPANGLDIEGMVEIRKIILKLREKNDTTFLISSHLSNEIEKTCTKVGIMYNAELVAESEMTTVLENYPSLEEYFLSVVEKNRSGETK